MRKNARGILFKMGLRSVKQNFLQFLSIIAIGGIAITLFVGLLANVESFENRVSTTYEKGNLPSLWVTTNDHDPEDAEILQEFLEEGDEMEGRFYCSVELEKDDMYACVTPEIPTLSCPFGTKYDPNATDFLILDDDLEQHPGDNYPHRYNVGSKVSFTIQLASLDTSSSSALEPYVLAGGKNVLAEGSITLTSRVTGFMNHPENITKSAYNPSVFLWSESSFRRAFDEMLAQNYAPVARNLVYGFMRSTLGFNPPSYDPWVTPNQYLISLKDPSRANALSVQIRNRFEEKAYNNLYAVAERGDMPFYVTLDADLTQARQFTYVFPLVFFIVAVLVILTTISQLIVKERTQIGTLKAMGFRKNEIYGHYLGITWFLTGLGTLFGEILGPIILPNIMAHKYILLYTLPPRAYVFPLLPGILSAVGFLAIASIVTIAVCHREMRLNPAESMRPVAPTTSLKTIESKHKGGVYSLSIKMALRNIRVSPKKTAMVIAGVMGCTALLVAGFGIEDTLYYDIDYDLSRYHKEEISLSFESPQTEDEILASLEGIEGIAEMEPIQKGAATFFVEDGPQIQKPLYVFSRLDPMWDLDFGKDEIAISTKCAKTIGASVGDTLQFRMNGVRYSAPIGLIFDAFFYNGIAAHAAADFFSDIQAFRYNGALVNVAEGYDPAEVDASLERLSFVSASQRDVEMEAKLNEILGSIMTMTDAMKAFAILLAIVVLYNLALLNFSERIRDIATLKVLGFRQREITLSLLTETLLLTLGGVLVGLALGFPFLLGVLGTNQVELIYYIYHMNASSFGLAFVLTFVVAVVVNLFLSLKIRRVKMVESLKSVE